RVAVQEPTQASEKAQVLWLCVVEVVILVRVGIVRRVAAAYPLLLRLGGVVPQQSVVKAEVDGIQPEAVHASVQPETQMFQHRLRNSGMMEIEIRLGREEIVQVVLLAARLPLPGRAAEDREPVVGGRAVGARIGPYVPVRLGIISALA